MQHTDYVDRIGADAINDDPGCVPDDQLSGRRNPADTSHIPVFRELIHRGSNALHGIPGRERVILGYVICMMIKVAEGGAQPSNSGFRLSPDMVE